MPIYEFYCEKCKDIFEYLSIGHNDIPLCPKCSSKNVTKQFSTFGFTSGGKTVTSSSGSTCSSCHSHNCCSCN